MAKKGFSLDFYGFEKLAETLDEQFDTNRLIWAAEVALQRSKEYVNNEINKVVNVGGGSKWSFDKGVAYSQGKAKDSFNKVANMPVRVVGTVVTAYAGFDLSEAPEVLLIAYGTPHNEKDKNIYNAIKVKGKVKRDIERIQKDTFTKALTYELDKEIWRDLNRG